MAVAFASVALILGTLSGFASAAEISLHGSHAVKVGVDDPRFADPNYDDRDWQRIPVPSSLRAAGLPGRPDLFWYRIRFEVPADWQSNAPAIRLGVITRSDETFLNGVKIGGVGIVGPANSDWHAYAPTTPRLYPVDPSLLRIGEENVLAIRGAREPYIDDGGIISGPVALVELPDALGEFQVLQSRFQSIRTVFFGIETLVFIVLLACIVIGIRSRMIRLFQLFYFPSFFFALEHRGILGLVGVESQLLQFLANISGALTVPILIEIVAHMFKIRIGLVGRAVQVVTVGALVSVPVTGVAVLDWWAIETSLVWHTAMLFGLGLVIVWSVWAFLRGMLYARTMVVGITLLACGLLLDLVFPLNYFEQHFGLRIAEIGILSFFLSIACVVMQSILERERSLKAANISIGRLHEHDRARMANDVHDGIGQWLGAMKIKLELLLNQPRVDGETNAPMMYELVSDLEQVIEDTRRLAYDLSPSFLQEHGLIGAMKTNALHVQSIVRISFDVEVPDGVALSAASELHAYRIFQEALGNAVKHSGAREIQVQVSQTHESFTMQVHDDGKWDGSKPASENRSAPSGLGLKSMHSRAKLMGGHLEIDPLGADGTIIKLTVPVHRTRSDA